MWVIARGGYEGVLSSCQSGYESHHQEAVIPQLLVPVAGAWKELWSRDFRKLRQIGGICLSS